MRAWVPRSKPEREKMRRNTPAAAEQRDVKLVCGHSTDGEPLVSSPERRYVCPEGCGLRAALR